jgi:hypothetical protein
MYRRNMDRQMNQRKNLQSMIDKSIRDKEQKIKETMSKVEMSMQNLTGEQEYKIQKDPVIRKKFAELCSIMEVDPLLISKVNKAKKEESSVHLKNFIKN